MNRRFSWQTAAIVILAAMLCFCLVKINELSSTAEALQARYMSEIGSLRGEINAIYENVEEELKQQASYLSSAEYSLGELDTASHTVSVNLTVVPKSITEDMELSVRFGTSTAALTRSGDGFSAKLPVNLFAGYGEHPLLMIKSGGETKTEYLENVNLSYLHSTYLPNLFADSVGIPQFSGGMLRFDGGIHVSAKGSESDAVTFVKYELAVEKNGSEIDRRDITGDMADGNYDGIFTGAYPANEGDEIVVYAIAEDSLGYVHRTTAHYWMEKNGAVYEMADAGEYIFDKSGSRLN